MTTWTKRFSGVCGVMFLLLVALPLTSSAQTLTGTVKQVTTVGVDQFDPAISGDLVVYTDFSGVDADVWYTDLSTGQEHPVSNLPGDQQLTGVSDNRIVYTDWATMDVLVLNVETGTTQNLTNPAGSNSIDPAISHDLVAWTDDRDGNSEIYARDLSTGEERRITNTQLLDQTPAVDNGIIVWEQCDSYTCDIFSYEWATGATTQLSNTPSVSDEYPDISGRVVVFQRRYGTPIATDLVAYDLDSHTETVLQLPRYQCGNQYSSPRISGDLVVFMETGSCVAHIGLWQISTNTRFQVTDGAEGQFLADIEGNRIVYSASVDGRLHIYLYEVTIVPPPADSEPPAIYGASDLTVDATSPFGAAVSFPVYATDNVDPAPALVCTPASGTVFTIGTTTQVTCTATDASLNSAAATFNVTVRAADAQLGDLADLVASLNLKQGIENSLDAKLSAALAALDAARAGAVGTTCSQLGAFINEVNAQAGKSITAADAAALMTAVSRIRAVLGCG